MTDQIDIEVLTAHDLKSGVYLAEFPEYYNLRGVIENSSWHVNQDVFDHVVKVYEHLEELLNFSFLPPELASRYRLYLSQKVGSHTRMNILRIATLLHDIAKRETLVVQADGTAACPGHEELAATKVKDFDVRFSLDSIAQAYVERIVRHHGLISETIAKMVSDPETQQESWNSFTATAGDIVPELLLFITADLQGCDLRSTTPQLYRSFHALQLTLLSEQAPV